MQKNSNYDCQNYIIIIFFLHVLSKKSIFRTATPPQHFSNNFAMLVLSNQENKKKK